MQEKLEKMFSSLSVYFKQNHKTLVLVDTYFKSAGLETDAAIIAVF